MKIPFGKYKGRDSLILSKDTRYLNWILFNAKNLRAKHPDFISSLEQEIEQWERADDDLKERIKFLEAIIEKHFPSVFEDNEIF